MAEMSKNSQSYNLGAEYELLIDGNWAAIKQPNSNIGTKHLLTYKPQNPPVEVKVVNPAKVLIIYNQEQLKIKISGTAITVTDI